MIGDNLAVDVHGEAVAGVATALETGLVHCGMCGRYQAVVATRLDPGVVAQLHDALTDRCRYVQTLHHTGEHDDLCPSLGCAVVEVERERSLFV